MPRPLSASASTLQNGAEPVPCAPCLGPLNAYYTDGRPSFTFDPLFHAGAYYVQEASSMFLEQALIACGLANADIIALDLCAAPGGKSTHLLSILGDDALLVSNEVVRPRAKILCDNITKWGRPNVCVTGSDTALFAGLPEFFDLVVVDAPCSGEGLFRKDADAMSHWSEEAVQQCAIRQSGILEHAWATLRPGGHLIYSTCTYNRSENEQQVQAHGGVGRNLHSYSRPMGRYRSERGQCGGLSLHAASHRRRGIFSCCASQIGRRRSVPSLRRKDSLEDRQRAVHKRLGRQ
jgi:16S rRNA C967 or C1407 C5-methylase (RsmB/RsmF family)